MQFTPETLNLLTSFSKINNGIVIHPGSNLSTFSDTKTVLAKAKLNQEFPGKMSIYDLSKFISILGLFDEPDVDVKENHAVISSGTKKLNFRFADESLITQPPAKEIKFPEPEVEVDITRDLFADVMKAQSVLRLPELALVGDGKKVSFQALDSKNDSADAFSVTVSDSPHTFRVIFKPEHLRILPDDYRVSISSKGLSYWKGERVEYYISIESNSTFSK